jgi:GGDEF domain-containing protein
VLIIDARAGLRAGQAASGILLCRNRLPGPAGDPAGEAIPPEASGAILVEIADRLKQKVRHTDTIARVSGWKFFTLHEDLKSTEDVEIILARLKQIITQPVRVGDVEYPLVIQTGLALSAPRYKQPAEIFEAAEQALKKARGL